MLYGRVENGNVLIGLPRVGVLRDGSTISGYNSLPENVLISEGWLPVEEDIPVYNQDTEMIQGPEYIVEVDRIISRYQAIAKPVSTPQVITPSTTELQNQLSIINKNFQDFVDFYFSTM